MSIKVRNSLSTFLDQALILTNNNIETLSKINEAVTSNEDSVTLTIVNPSNPNDELTYNIPSFGYLKNAIDRLDATISTMSNINGTTGSRLRLSDGSYRKIITSKVPTEAPTITTVDNITNFEFKSNWFFEDMLNPMLYVSWNFTDQISENTERVMIQRYILDCDTPKKKNVFDKLFNRKNDIRYKDFLYALVENNIKYSLDDEIKDLPPRSKRYYGNFSVVRGEIEDNVYYTGRSMRYTLVGLEYTDSRAGVENTCVLSIGDVLEVNTDPVTTRYEVTYVDVSANKIGLKCIEGLEPVRVGKDTLRISSTKDSEVKAEIPIGYDERQVIFVKAIDPDSNIPSSLWSNGVGFYSNELTYVDSNGNTKTLQSFYQKNVVDFGQMFLSYSEDYYPTIHEGITPNEPVLNYANGEGDFKIVQINSQLTEDTDTDTFRQLIATKGSILSSIEANSKAIEKQKTTIQTTDFIDSSEKVNAQEKLSSLIEEQTILVSNYNSTVNTIKAKCIDGATVTPKYRVRGFWDMPDEKISSSSGKQKIIKFKIRYRYLSNTGVANKEEEFKYTSNGIKVTGRFSNWNEIETKLRPRVKVNGSWEWESVDTSNPDVVNINQLDIPIQKGEQVEIQVKSVCEAGFPSNPMESKWSEPIIVAFSDFAELEADDLTQLIEQNKVDAAVTNVTTLFKPMNSHISSSFYVNDKYFAHSAQEISSGFLSPEQSPITLYDKLQDLQSQVTQIIEQINYTAGNLIVTLCTSDTTNTKKYNLNEKGVTYINAGSYVSSVNILTAATNPTKKNTSKNGTIVTKTFYLDITTDVQSGLFLLSKLAGNRNIMVPSTISKRSSLNSNGEFDNESNFYDIYDNVINPSTTSSTYYKTKGRYDLVPINLTGANNNIDFTTVCPDRYQSAQCKGQFVYSRFRDVSDTFDMYANDTEETMLFATNGGVISNNITSKKKNYEYGIYNENARFSNSELYIGPTSSATSKISMTVGAKKALYGTTDYKEAEFDTYCRLTQTEGIDFVDAEMNLDLVYPILYRIPRNWNKKPSTSASLFGDKDTVKIIKRIELSKSGNDTTLTPQDSLNIQKQQIMTNKLLQRISDSTNLTAVGNSLVIEPKIQSAFGLSDWGRINNIDLDGGNTLDDGSYVTTHKIGYSDSDKYLTGESTCNSYLFLSPINHESIQVEGDTVNSTAVIDSNSSIRVPIVYQYRMVDYSGNIFGIKGLKPTDERVKNARFANIIGIDIWTDTSSEEPLQYDIVVYSSYGDSAIIDTANILNDGTQNLVDTSNRIANNLQSLVLQSTSTTNVETSKTQTLHSNNPNLTPVSTIKTSSPIKK